MIDEELIAIVQADVDACRGQGNTTVSSQREKALEYYLGEPYGNELEGRSQVVTTEVSNAIEWIKPQLLKIFTSTNKIVEFAPCSQEDEAAAKQETAFLNHVFYNDNDGFKVLYTWFNDALLQKNGIIKYFWDESEEKRPEDLMGLDEMQLTALLAEENVDVLEYDEVFDDITGVPRFDVRIERKIKKGQMRVLPIPPESFLVYDNWNDICLENVPFCAHESEKSREELLDEGVSKKIVDQLSFGMKVSDVDDEGRFDDIDANSSNVNYSHDTTTVYECYKRVDYNDDGYAELRKITYSDGVLISNEEVDYIPFVAITPVIMSHRFYGRSIADLIMDLQLIKSTLLRNILDNFYHINNVRTLILDGEVNIDDLLDNRIGGIVRTTTPNAVQPLPVTPFSGHAFQMLEYFDNLGENRSGVTKYTQGLDGESLNKTATGVNKIMNASQERIMLIARVFAEGLRRLFLGMHRLLQQNQDYARMVRMSGQWVSINPSEWHQRDNMSINVSLGSGDKEAEILKLQGILAMQKEAMASGANTVVTPKHIYNTVAKIVEASGFKDVDAFFADPATVPPPQPKPDMQQEMLKMQAQIEERKAQIDEMEARIKGYEAQIEAAYKQRELELKELEITGKLVKDREAEELQERRLDLSKYQTDIKARTDMEKIDAGNQKQN